MQKEKNELTDTSKKDKKELEGQKKENEELRKLMMEYMKNTNALKHKQSQLFKKAKESHLATMQTVEKAQLISDVDLKTEYKKFGEDERETVFTDICQFINAIKTMIEMGGD